MSTFAIDDLLVAEESLRDLKDRELKLSGGASAGSAAAADYNDAVSASAATTDGYVSASARGGYRDSYYYYGYYESGPSASAYASDRYDYPWYY